MRSAQQNLMLVLNLRAQALTRIAEKLGDRPGPRRSQAEAATAEIAGQMQMFLTSDVVYSQRTAPLIKQALDEASITGQTIPASRSLPGYTWLAPETVANAIGGQTVSGSAGGDDRARLARPRPDQHDDRHGHAAARRRARTRCRPSRRRRSP